MRQNIRCHLCHKPGYSNEPSWYHQLLLLAVRPNIRNKPKTWVCRACITINAGLPEHDFLALFDKPTPQKPGTRARR